MSLMEKWKEGVMMYRAGIHPNQDRITLTLAEYLSKHLRKREET